MKRPLLYVLGFYIAGVLMGWYIVDKTFIALFFMFILVFSYMLYKNYSWKGIFIFPIFTVIGFITLLMSISPTNKSVELLAQNEQTVEIFGRVIDIDYTTTERQKIIVQTDTITSGDLKINDNLKIQAILDLDDKVKYNQIVVLEGDLQTFDFKRNPGGFDEKLYMNTRKIDYKMFAGLKSSSKVINNFKLYIYEIHEKMNYVYDNLLPEKEASVLKAMLLGDKKNLDTSIKEIYRKAGISHILAISGLHISILSGLLWLLLNHLGFNKRVNSLIVLIILVLYCIFTGSSVSTVRSVTMIGIVLFGAIIYREADIYTSIGTAALTLLIYQPLYLFDAGFQLSFGAVSGIIILSPILERIHHIPKKIKPYLMSSLAASIVTYPIVAFHFNTISLVGIVINIFVLPFAALLVGFGLLSGIVGLISITAGKFMCGIVYFILVLYENICEIGGNTAFSEMITGEPNIILILFYYSMILIISFYYYNLKAERLRLKKYIFIVGTSFLIITSIIIFKPKELELVYLDVNQGDSIVIHTKDNKNLLIDGGGNIRKEIGEPNTGSQIVAPYLKYKGITSLDCVFVSHPDADHILGIIELIDYIKIKQIVVSPNIENNKLFIALKKKSDEHSIPIVQMSKGDTINFKNNLSIQCLYPYKDISIGDDWNNGSLVFHMKYGSRTFMFSGDIEKEAEFYITNNYRRLNSDILKSAHHGSKTSSTKDFLDIVNPTAVIISSGRNNSYGHPHKEVIDRYKAFNTKIYNTATDGAVIVKSDGNKLWISTMKAMN